MQIHIARSINGLSLPVCRSPFCASKLYISLVLTMLSWHFKHWWDSVRTHKSLKLGGPALFLPIESPERQTPHSHHHLMASVSFVNWGQGLALPLQPRASAQLFSDQDTSTWSTTCYFNFLTASIKISNWFLQSFIAGFKSVQDLGKPLFLPHLQSTWQGGQEGCLVSLSVKAKPKMLPSILDQCHITSFPQLKKKP